MVWLAGGYWTITFSRISLCHLPIPNPRLAGKALFNDPAFLRIKACVYRNANPMLDVLVRSWDRSLNSSKRRSASFANTASSTMPAGLGTCGAVPRGLPADERGLHDAQPDVAQRGQGGHVRERLYYQRQ